jgi:hypothetical protein
MLGAATVAVRARAFLGYWPTPNHPDPKVLPSEFDQHIEVASAIVLCLFLSVPIIFILGVISRLFLLHLIPKRPFRIYLAGVILIILNFYEPRLGFVAWLAD